MAQIFKKTVFCILIEIGANCTIGHSSILHGCKIGDNSLIGMGAVVLNGAIIGKNCLIAASALVKEGAEIPDNSLVVGMPGKIIRQIDDNGIEKLKTSAIESFERFSDSWAISYAS